MDFSKLKGSFTARLGPLPVYIWALIVLGVLVVGYLLWKRGQGSGVAPVTGAPPASAPGGPAVTPPGGNGGPPPGGTTPPPTDLTPTPGTPGPKGPKPPAEPAPAAFTPGLTTIAPNVAAQPGVNPVFVTAPNGGQAPATTYTPPLAPGTPVPPGYGSPIPLGYLPPPPATGWNGKPPPGGWPK